MVRPHEMLFVTLLLTKQLDLIKGLGFLESLVYCQSSIAHNRMLPWHRGQCSDMGV